MLARAGEQSMFPAMPASLPRRPWLFGPATDLLIGCGGWTLPLLLVASAAQKVAPDTLTLSLYLGVLICNQPHYAATLWRAFVRQTDRHRHRRLFVHLSVIAIATLALLHLLPASLPLFFAIYLTWSPFHYSAQNYGIALVLLGRGDVKTSPPERLAYKGAFIGGYIAWALSLHTGPQLPSMSKLSLDPSWTQPAQLILWAGYFVVVATLLVRWHHRAKDQGRAAVWAVTVLSATQFFWLGLAAVLMQFSGNDIEPLFVSGGALAFLHCAQYLWIVRFVERQDPIVPALPAWQWFGALVLIGVALFLPGPWVLSLVAGQDLLVSLVAFQTVVNLHHFIVDGQIWKLRDARVKARLLQAPTEAPRPRRHLGPGRLAAASVVTIFLLSVWGADFIRTRGTLPGASDDQAAQIAQLAPDLSPVVLRQAVAQVTAGDDAAAEQTLRSAIAHGNKSADVHRALASLLAASGRRQEAIAAFQSPSILLDHDVTAAIQLTQLAIESQDVTLAERALRAARHADRWHPSLPALSRQLRALAAAQAQKPPG